MEEKKERGLVSLELSYDDPKDLVHLMESEYFIKIVLENAYKEIKYAIENKKDKARLFNIANLSIIIELKEENYNKVLGTILTHYEKQEDFEKCSEIQALLNTPS